MAAFVQPSTSRQLSANIKPSFQALLKTIIKLAALSRSIRLISYDTPKLSSARIIAGRARLCSKPRATISHFPRVIGPASCRLNFSTFLPRRNIKMASDEDYMSFLDKANQDPSAGVPKTNQPRVAKAEFKTTDSGVEIPAPLKEVTQNAFYTSDADEPFVPVALKWDEAGKGLPDEEEISRLINHPDPANAHVEILDPVDWDTQGQYKDIIDAVTKAGKGNDVRVYRISKDGVRVEYWVVTTEGKGSNAKLVGVKALAVES